METSSLAGLGLELGSPISTDLVTTYRLGAGWVAVVEDVDQVTEEEWGSILTPARYQTAARDAWQSPEMSLMQSAASGGDQRVPTIPWLLAALVGYAVLVGPVNFGLLSKFGRREMAWVTIPILAVLGVAGFWIAGRQRLQTHVLNHGTVIVASDEGINGSTATVIAVGRSGRQVVKTDPSWTTYPFAATMDGGGGILGAIVPAELTADGGFAFDLDSLGAAGIQSQWAPSGSLLPKVDFTFSDNEVEVTVDNDTPYEFWAWGIAARGRAGVAPDSLASGAQGTESVRPGVNGQMEFGSVGDAVINERQLWEDPFIWNRIGTLGTAGTWELDDANTYFFAFSDDVEVPIDLDGGPATAEGTTLILIPFDLEANLGEGGSATAHLLDAGDASWVDHGPGYFSVQSKKMTIGWLLGEEAPTDPTLLVGNMFGEIPRYMAFYDWTESEFVEVSSGDSVDLDRFRSATGEVVLQAWSDEPENIDVAFENRDVPVRVHVGVVTWQS